MKKFYLIILILITTSTTSFAQQIKLTATTIDGKIFDLEQQKNKITIVTFWAKWCPECRKELPILNEIYKKYHSRGLEVIAITSDSKKHWEQVKKITEPLNFLISFSSDIKFSNIKEPNEIPLSYIINKNGTIVAKVVPLEDADEMEVFENEINKLW